MHFSIQGLFMKKKIMKPTPEANLKDDEQVSIRLTCLQMAMQVITNRKVNFINTKELMIIADQFYGYIMKGK